MLRRVAFAVPKGKIFGNPEDVVDCGEVDLKDCSFTIELWVRRIAAGEYHVAVFQGSAGTNKSLFVGFRNTDVFMLAFGNNDLDTTDVYSETGEWHHWPCVYDRVQGTRVIYRDGGEVARDTPASGYEGAGKLVIGAEYDSSGSYLKMFAGQIGEVRVWNMARSQEQINRDKNLYQRGTQEGLVVYRPLENALVV